MDAFLSKVLTAELGFLTADSEMQRERNDLRRTCSEMKQSLRIKNLNRILSPSILQKLSREGSGQEAIR